MPSTTVSKHPGGRPSKYADHMLEIAQSYFEECQADRERIPYLEELDLILGISDETRRRWKKQPDKEEFCGTIKKVLVLQELRLIQNCQTMAETLRSIFLLKVVHGYRER